MAPALRPLATVAASAACSVAVLAIVFLVRRRRRRFAGFDEQVPESTRQALAKDRWLPLRHWDQIHLEGCQRELTELLG